MRGFLGFAVLLFYLILVVVPFLLLARFWPIVLLLAIIGGLVLLHEPTVASAGRGWYYLRSSVVELAVTDLAIPQARFPHLGAIYALCPPKLLMREVMDRLRRFLSGLSIVVAGLLAVTVVWTVLTISGP